MNIFVDENVPQQVVTLLRTEGHQVEYVTRQVEDRIILEVAYNLYHLPRYCYETPHPSANRCAPGPNGV